MSKETELELPHIFPSDLDPLATTRFVQLSQRWLVPYFRISSGQRRTGVLMFQPRYAGSNGVLDSPNVEPHEQEARLTFIDLWKVLLKRRLIVAITAVVGVIVTALYTWHLKPIYQSSARLEIDQPANASIGGQNVMAEGGVLPENTVLPTQIRILESDTVMLETAQRYRDLHGANPGTVPSKHEPLGKLPLDEQEWLINSVRGAIHTNHPANADSRTGIPKQRSALRG